MMKQRWLILVPILLLAVVLWLLLRPEPVEIARLLPRRTAVFVELKDIQSGYSRLDSSPFWRELTATPLWKRGKIEERWRDLINFLSQESGLPLDRDRLFSLIGRDLGLALISGEKDGEDPTLLIVSRVSWRSRVIEFFSRHFQASSSPRNYKKYGGTRIFHSDPSASFPFYLSWAFRRGYLFITVSSGGDEVVREVLDTPRSSGGVLAASAGFIRFQRDNALSSPGVKFYCQARPLRRVFRRVLGAVSISGAEELPDPWKSSIRKLRSGLTGIFSAGGGSLQLKDGLIGRFWSEPAPDRPRKDYVREPPPKAAEFKDWEYLPAATIFCLSCRTDPSLLVRKFKRAFEVVSPSPGLLWELGAWEEKSGLRLSRDLLPWMGEESAVAVVGFDWESLIPLPRTVGFIQIKDNGQADRFLDQLTAYLSTATGVSPRRMKYSGLPMTVFPYLISDPGWVEMDNLLIIGTSRDLLRKVVETKREKSLQLASDPDFRKISTRIGGEADQYLYFNTSRLIGTILKLGDWYRQRQTGNLIPGKFYNEELVPFLRVLGKTGSFAARNRLQDGVAICDFFWYIPDLNLKEK